MAKKYLQMNKLMKNKKKKRRQITSRVDTKKKIVMKQ